MRSDHRFEGMQGIRDGAQFLDGEAHKIAFPGSAGDAKGGLALTNDAQEAELTWIESGEEFARVLRVVKAQFERLERMVGGFVIRMQHVHGDGQIRTASLIRHGAPHWEVD